LADLINPRWVDIPIEDIYRQLVTLGLTTWQPKPLDVAGSTRYYLFAGDYAYPYSLPLSTIEVLANRLNENYMTWYKAYNEWAMGHFNDKGVALNQAADYWREVGDTSLPKPEILPVDGLSDGDEYMAIIGLFHLTGAENGNSHNLFIDMIDRNGNRIYHFEHSPPLALRWEWDGITPEEISSVQPIIIDKPPNEPGANIGLSWNQVVYGFYINNMACDRFRGVHVRYESDGIGNDRGHHSHYVILQKRRYQSGTVPPDPEPPDPEPDPPTPPVETIKIVINKAWLASLEPDDNGNVTLYCAE
jgi:hypothetical protein